MRNNILFLFLILTIFSSCSIEKSQVKILNTTEEIIHDKIIVAFGDSLTYGYGIDREYSYPSQLQKELDELEYNIKVYNSGLSGETTTAALNRVEWVLQLNPDIVILTIGGNDAIRGIDIEITKSNIEKIINIFNNNNVTIILSGMEIYENMGEQYVSEFKQIYFDIAKDKNVSFIPFFLEGVAGNTSLNIGDRIHPNKEGYSIIVKQNILPVLLPILENKS